MRLVHLSVPAEQRSTAVEALEDHSVDYAIMSDGEDERFLIEFPIPVGGLETVLEALREAGIDESAYTVITSVETALTPHTDDLRREYGSTYSPMPSYSIRSKAQSLSRDKLSYVCMLFLSAVIATAGLLTDSPAIVVGSMVIAPVVGPVLTASVGTVTRDTGMVFDSVRYQALAILVTVLGATLAGLFFRWIGFVPSTLNLTGIELIGVRVAPSPTTMIVGFAAGSAAAFGLTTEGPMSLIGVMIAAALVPAAATVGIGLAWGETIPAFGALLLLLATFVMINLGVLGTLLSLGYRRSGPYDSSFRQRDVGTVAIAVVAALALLVAGVATVGAVQQANYERSVNAAIDATLDEPAYEELDAVATVIEYGYGPGSLGTDRTPESVTVRLTTTTDGEYEDLPGDLQAAIESRTGTEPTVQVEFVRYNRAE